MTGRSVPVTRIGFNKSIQTIRRAVEEGRFGTMMHGTAHVRWNRGESYYTQAPWRGTWAQDGGALMNQCIHNIDLLRWMMGNEIDEVFAYTAQLAHPYLEAEDLGLALVKFKNGSYGIIEGTTNVYPKNLEETLYLFGTTGTAKAGGKSVNIIEEWAFADTVDDAETVMADACEGARQYLRLRSQSAVCGYDRRNRTRSSALYRR
jgi:UDP-N-acetyl-2-amino-2-deoxyglucuronate dehydrogenase